MAAALASPIAIAERTFSATNCCSIATSRGACVAIRAAIGKYSSAGIENAGLYWHFVDLVWVFVFALFYLV